MSQLAAISDVDPGALEAATADTGAEGFSDPSTMLARAGLDAVVIAAPTMSHLPLALAALELGVAVLVEKPLAATPDEAAEVVAAAAAAGRHRSRLATSSGSIRLSWNSAACSTAAGFRPSTPSPAGGPARSRHASATSG